MICILSKLYLPSCKEGTCRWVDRWVGGLVGRLVGG